MGAASVTCPLYLAEMAPPDRRGRMVTINELMIVTGQMLAFAMNALLDHVIRDPHVWRIMLAVAAVPAIALLLGMIVAAGLPALVRAEGQAWKRLARCWVQPDRREADAEYAVDRRACQPHAEDPEHPFSVIRDVPWIRRVVLIGCGLADHAAGDRHQYRQLLRANDSRTERTGRERRRWSPPSRSA